jgi:glycerol uptake facilitator-like aquaporin
VTLGRKLAAEALGTGLLLAAVVGSGIMAERLAGGNAAVALLANTLATGAALAVLILIFGPVSGAHFNPAVTLACAWRGEMAARHAALYVLVQAAAAVAGVLLAHAMFDLPVWQISEKVRSGPGQWLSEFVATFGLLLTIFGCVARQPQTTPYAAGLYIAAAYWFTASTSFANPAVTVARSLSNTFAGIAPSGAAAFIAAQLAGAMAGVVVANRIFARDTRRKSPGTR